MSLSSALGLRAASSLSNIPNYGPYYIMFHFVFAYAGLSTRFFKIKHGLDHNVNPREDIDRFGEKSVQSGKITRKQLNMWKRIEAAHANSVEHFPMFAASIVCAIVTKLPSETINKASLAYTVVRMVYATSYITNDDHALSRLRSVAWWAGNFSCLYLLWHSGKALNTTSL